jgi:hypothetical protein
MASTVYTSRDQLPQDPETWGDAEYLVFYRSEAESARRESLQAKVHLAGILRVAGEQVVPLTWEFLLPVVAEKLGVSFPVTPSPEMAEMLKAEGVSTAPSSSGGDAS